MAEAPVQPPDSGVANVGTAANESADVGAVEIFGIRMKMPDSTSSNSDTEGEGVDAVAGEGGDGALESGGRLGSPPPNCAICLSRCKNKCFTDSCIHQFCFKCLCEWSKVKAECPLCKQSFKSIIHNVKSSDQFERYHVQPPTVQIPHRPNESAFEQLPYIVDGVVIGGRNDYEVSIANWTGFRASDRARSRRAMYSAFSAITGGAGISGSGINRSFFNTVDGGENVQNGIFRSNDLVDMYQREYPDETANDGATSQRWRRYVYDRKFFARPVRDVTGRYRDTSARFFRNNPAQIHRLMPFITRDITCLLRNTEHDLTLVLERIKESVTLYNILSPAFRRMLQPFLGSRTAHFIHELHNYARSPYDIIGYDREVRYSTQITDDIIEFTSSTSSDEENIANTLENETGEPSRIRESHNSRNIGDYRVQSRLGSNDTIPPLVNLFSFTISTTSEGAEATGITAALNVRGTQSTAINLTTHNRANEFIIDLDETDRDGTEAAGTSTSTSANVEEAAATTAADTPSSNVASAIQQSAQNSATSAAVTENIELTSSSSDECEFVLEKKPPHLRTPEMVSLNSESDSDVVFVTETKMHKYAFVSTDDENIIDTIEAADNSAVATDNGQRASEPANSSVTTAVKNERNDIDLYNAGPSTSAGLQRSRRSVRKQSQRQPRRRHSRSAGAVQRRSKRQIARAFHASSSNVSSSDSDSETEFMYKRPRTRARVQRKDLQMTKGTKRDSRTAQNAECKRAQKISKCTFRDVSSDTSEEDESLSLKILKYRLAQEARTIEAAREQEIVLQHDLQRDEPTMIDATNNLIASINDDGDCVTSETPEQDTENLPEVKPNHKFLDCLTTQAINDTHNVAPTARVEIDAIPSSAAANYQHLQSLSHNSSQQHYDEKPICSKNVKNSITLRTQASDVPTSSIATQNRAEASTHRKKLIISLGQRSTPLSRTTSNDSMSSGSSSTSSTTTTTTSDNSNGSTSSDDSDDTNTSNTDATVGTNAFNSNNTSQLFSTTIPGTINNAPAAEPWLIPTTNTTVDSLSAQDSLPSQMEEVIESEHDATGAEIELAFENSQTETGLDLSTYTSLDMFIYSDEDNNSEAMTEQPQNL